MSFSLKPSYSLTLAKIFACDGGSGAVGLEGVLASWVDAGVSVRTGLLGVWARINSTATTASTATAGSDHQSRWDFDALVSAAAAWLSPKMSIAAGSMADG